MNNLIMWIAHDTQIHAIIMQQIIVLRRYVYDITVQNYYL